MKKYQLGLIGVGLLLVGGLVGYGLIPKLVGAVSYFPAYESALYVSGDSALHNTTLTTTTVTGALTVTGVFTPATLAGYVTSSLTTLTVSGASSLASGTFSSTLGVTGTSTLHIVSTTGAMYVHGNETLSGTLGVSGISSMATTSVLGSFCVWNGTEWTKITFSGATPSYATSTTCL